MGRKVAAKTRRFRETVLFFPWLHGTESQLASHQSFVAELGFDSIAFKLSGTTNRIWQRIPLLKKVDFHLRQLWQEEVLAAMREVSGPKILYSFSLPSTAVAEALAQVGCRDISAWICDGGPFFELPKCMWNYYTYVEPEKFLPKKLAQITLGLQAVGYPRLVSEVSSALRQLPDGFPVLSVRAWQDRLVPISAIEQVFEGKSNLHLESLTLPEADHLRGLQDFPNDYKPSVSRFLNETSERLSTSEVSL